MKSFLRFAANVNFLFPITEFLQPGISLGSYFNLIFCLCLLITVLNHWFFVKGLYKQMIMNIIIHSRSYSVIFVLAGTFIVFPHS